MHRYGTFSLIAGFGLLLTFAPHADTQVKDDEIRDALLPWIQHEVGLKNIPSLSIALVDDQRVVFAASVGYADPKAKERATPDTLYRVGSVSKPFTAILLMILVELGLIDLDAPVQDYLPEFQPKNKYGKKITLRQMLSHRSGVVREGPVGNYFDDTHPTLEATVKSLNKTELVFEPGAKESYSNMALATVGYVIERTQKEPFEKFMQRKLLQPIGMKNSTFAPTANHRKLIPKAPMWTYHGREFPAPTMEMGMSPAGNLYSSVNDQAKFLQFLFAGGKGVIKKETLEQMYKIQYPKKDEKGGFGLGFYVGDFLGKRMIRHGGAVYGFATEFAALPDEKVGVIVCASKDVSFAVTSRIAFTSLRYLLAKKEGTKPIKLEHSEPLDPKDASELAGRYRAVADPSAQGQEKSLEICERAGRAWMFRHQDDMKVEFRKLGSEYIIDDLHVFGTKFKRDGKKLVIGKDTYEPIAVEKPRPLPAKWAGVIGEYGPDYNVTVIFEKNGQLWTQIEWVFVYPLKEISENEYQFPDYGLYMGDRITFIRDKSGVATHIDAASMLFKRRAFPKPGETFKIEPVRAIDELRKIALAAKPPEEKNPLFKKPDLVDLESLDKSIKLDIRYFTGDNFLGTKFYTSPRAFLQRPAAEALVKVHQDLAAKGYGLLIHDAYRPWHVTKMFRDATPATLHHFVADPLQGSRHNRGCAVDLTLYDLKSGKVIEMPGGYDEMTDRSYPDYLGGTSLQRWHRDLLRNAMEKHGFKVYEAEWWHFDFHDWRAYPILNLRFEELK